MFKYFYLLLFVLLCSSLNLAAQNRQWVFVNENDADKLNTARVLIPQNYKTLLLDFEGYKSYLSAAPKEFASVSSGMVIEIPYPDNTFQRFNIKETKLMEDGLAEQLPGIKTFVGYGIDDPYATIRLDYTYQGFHAFVRSPNGNVFIDPYQKSNTGLYVSYFSKDYRDPLKETFECKTEDAATSNFVAAGTCIGSQLKTYRLALACTGEYATAVSSPSAPSMPLTASAMVTSVNRVVGVYETELGIRLVLIANNNLLIYLDGATDPYSNGNGSTMLGQNQTNVTSVIGSANYDIGHVFSTGGGGVAGLGVVCSSGNKARGVTGSTNPVGDNYDIDYVAHEMGHQFGGNHTFNSVTSSCGGGNRNASTAYEVGSGTTIMAYAGICGADNIQAHSDPYFHTKSFDEIIAYTTSGNGAGCPVVTSTGNVAPTVIMPANNQQIPKGTPFVLTGNGFDADGDAITYNWEEWDLGTSGTWNSGAANTTRPLFKSRVPLTVGRRYFPALPVILAGYPASPTADMGGLKGETLPTVARTIKFRLTVRDNQPGGGGVATGGDGCSSTAMFNVIVTDDGPFVLTSPNTALVWQGGSTQTITWDVANTNAAGGINCQNVDILMSTDGGLNFNTVVLSNTPNDGSEDITVPAINSTTVRFMVKANGNIFFDISDVNMTITSPLPIALLDFNVTAVKDALQLNWSASQEQNNKGFEILKSEGNAAGFVKVGFVNGAGNSSSVKKYSFSDRNIRKGVEYFYRLRQVDIDGHSSLSDIRKGRLNEDGKLGMVLSPNPVVNELGVYLNGLDKSDYSIILSDISGRVISTNTYRNNSSSNKASITMDHLAKGMYVLKLIQADKVLTQKVMKQ
ncbi:zinc-dependent metalloprotease family protein [Ferruginibacter sp. HRS2-29]|uniref:reprolysin-like metallopeptidase n=1 Tax=Ferruginibacter sp. HRS2-29 TaxID=2487334 RepID=UPI0020CC42A5|nr:zinc-dependent metalloprotease family protein [Ferruginibacter sp. HRS2-29]MCP9751782.1 T9SS C-terminal target domain-containing protein [Ferruginibacter sp. HRS2-29]